MAQIPDPTLPWLWCRPVATAPVRPLAWEPPYAAGEALEKDQKKKKKKKRSSEPCLEKQCMSRVSRGRRSAGSECQVYNHHFGVRPDVTVNVILSFSAANPFPLPPCFVLGLQERRG